MHKMCYFYKKESEIKMVKHKLLLFSCGQLDVLQQLQSELFGTDLSQLKTVCITTAANVYPLEKRDWQTDEMNIFREFGLNLELLDIADKPESEVVAVLSDADIIYVTGGNTYYLLEHAQKCQLKEIVTKRLNAGALYIGCSAGAVLTCPTIDFIAEMDDPELANITDFSGLGLVDFLIMPHTDHPKYGLKAKQIIQEMKSNGSNTLGLRDSQAVFVNGKYIEVYG